MDNAIFNWFNQFFSKELAVFFTAWLPIVELRGAIPLAISLGISLGGLLDCGRREYSSRNSLISVPGTYQKISHSTKNNGQVF